MKAMRWVQWGLLLSSALALSGAARAQTTGSIRGAVKDQSGAIVPTAQVTVTQLGTDNTRTAALDKDGEFSFAELPVGHYLLTVESAGFKKFEVKDVAVDLGHVTVVNAPLQLGEAAQTVTVEAEAAQVETTSTQLGAVMTDLAVRQLPLTTRDTYQLLQLQPGVQSQVGADLFYGSDQAGVVSVNGGRGRSNNYMVNGGDGNDIFANLPAIQPSPDAIEEFRVLTNTFDAEYGRNSGSVVNVVTKSGTNKIHGDVFDFFRNTILDSRGFFDPSIADYKQNQFGFTLGGPIKKDSTFIFGSYEGNRLRQGRPSGNVVIPTTAEQSGNFSEGFTQGQTNFPGFTGVLTDQNAANVLNARPGCSSAVAAEGGAPIAAGTSYLSIFPNNQIPTSCFDPTALDLYNQFVLPFSNGSGVTSQVPDKAERGDQFTVRFDHKLNTNQQLSVYYYFDDVRSTQPFSFFQAAGANLPGFGALFTTRVQQWNISHTWTIGATSVNEFRFNYFREGQGNLNHPLNILSSVHASCATVPQSLCFQDPSLPGAGITTNLPGREGVPFINVSGGFSIGNNFEGELPQIGNTFQWADNYTEVLGKHTLKFGGDIRRQRFDQFLYFEINGDYTFMSNASGPVSNDVGFGSAFPNYFLGLPTSYGQGAAQGENVRNTEEFLFIQDSWKLRPNLTLNYGLRWEFNSPYIDLGNRLQTFRPGQVSTQYPCVLTPASAAALGSSTCNGAGVTPVGLVFPNDPGVPRGLTQTYYKSFAPRIGLAWSPEWSTGWLAKLTGGPGKSSVRLGWGLFYNPIEQLVLEQFSAEPPFGGSTFISNPLFNTPFELQSGGAPLPNVFGGIINQTPTTPCPVAGGPPGCVDFSLFRPILLFGEFQPHLRSQYSVQYNFTLQREIAKDYILQIGYVGTQAHRLLASHDLNIGDAATCLALNQIPGQSCGQFGSDSSYFIPANSIPAGVTLPLPYGSVPSVTGPNNPAITLVGLRPFSSPLCQPTTGQGCPLDNTPVFSNIFAEDTIANSNYNSLQASLEKHFSKGLLFTLAYTWSKSIDQASSFENELNPINFRASRGLSLFDARNRIVFSPYWQLPVRKMSGFAGKALDGWAVSGIITYQSGFPIRLFSANDQELASSFFFEPAGKPDVTGPVQFLNPHSITTPTGLPSGNYLFNPNSFTNQPLGSFGDAPHALCCGPAISQTDLSFQKTTPINEKLGTEFRADIFNIWNHTQFLNPDGNFSNLGTTFGLVTKARDPRLVQFALKLIF
jgi:Carboxypeptidase regulatory-like domain/TonB-dependent Receptor Plug Domain